MVARVAIISNLKKEGCRAGSPPVCRSEERKMERDVDMHICI